jgi:translation initiation factor 1A
MVKNAGGNKTKGQARKFASSGPKADVLRISEDKCEVYGMVEKILGNGMCHVLCIDNTMRLCHIRGKFRGRGKRDNTLETGTWTLVGLREWEQNKTENTKSSDKLENCDLLEVYSNLDKERLKSTVKNVKWRLFSKNDDINGDVNEVFDDDSDDEELGFTFAENKNEEIDKLIAAEIASKGQVTNIVIDNSDWIDADDI